MMNQIGLVGRLANKPEKKELNDKVVYYITLAVPRSYKNINGEYETDFIDITLWNYLTETVAEYLTKGDLVGVKGRIQSNFIADDDGNIITKGMEIVAEKITFLSSQKKDTEENND